MMTASEDAETITRLERRRFAAVLAGDVATLEILCHPKLEYTHSNGETDTFESYIQKCRDRVWDFHHIDHPVRRTSIIENIAIVLGEMNATLTVDGIKKSLRNVTLAVWIRVELDWRLLAFHPTPQA